MNNRTLTIILALAALMLWTAASSADDQTVLSEEKPGNAHVWDGQVSRVAVFKNGLGFFMREGDVEYRDGWALAGQVPPALFGTLSIYSHEPDQMVDIVGSGPGEIVAFDGVDAPDTVEARRRRLEAWKGLKLQVEYRHEREPRTAVGKLESVAADFVIVAGPDNHFAVPLAAVTKVQVLELPLRMHVSGENGEVPESGRLGMAYLRKGITWIPDYTLEILDEDTAELTLRGTLVNEAEDIIGCDVSFVVGVPHFVHTDYLAPLAVGQIIRSVSTSVAPDEVRTQIRTRAALVSNVAGSRQFDVVEQEVDRDAGRAVTELMGNLPRMDGQAGTDYTVYTKENLTLRRGEKAIVTLFRVRINYDHVYRWDACGGGMRHYLVLHNDTDTAWTTGPCLTVENSNPLSQDLLKYVPRGGTGEIPVSTAINIAHEKSESEVDRKLKAHSPRHNVFLDLVTLEGRLRLRNFEDRAVRVVITNRVPGRPISADNDGSISVDTDALKLQERAGSIRWEIKLEPGESKTLTYQYERYVPSM